MSGIIKPPVGAQLKRDHPLARGLVGCWLLNEGSGDKAHDYSGQGNLGTLTNMDPATDWVGSLHGGALDFDGSNDCMDVGASSVLEPTTGLTVVAWVKRTGALANFSGIFSSRKLSNNKGYMLVGDSSNYINFYLYGDSGWIYAKTNNPISLNISYQIIGTWDGSTVRIYVNGILQTTTGITANISYPTTFSQNHLIGQYGGSPDDKYWPGIIDEVQIYNRALSAQEIAWLYAFPYAMFEEESPYWIPLKAAGGSTYNEAVTFSSAPACSHSPQADLLGSVAFASTPALSPAGIADLLGAVTILSNPAVSMAHVLDIFPSLILASNPALAASAIANFYNNLTLASTPAAVMAAIADLIAGLALASDPAFAALGGSDFYESLALSSSPALSAAVFKAAFGELSLASSPALSAAAIADLYAAITTATSGGISTAALADLFAALTLSSIPALSALGQIAGEVIQKMVMESIGVREKLLRTKKQEADGDIDIRNLILTNPYDEIAPVSTTWERTEKIQKDVQ